MIQYLFMGNEQTHPLHETDKYIIDSLITKKTPEDLDYINLARLINRYTCLLYTSPSPRDTEVSRMPSSA